MKVFLLKDVEKIGFAGEILKVKDGFASNYLVPRKLAVEITTKNAPYYESKVKNVEHRKEAVATKTSMLAEKISSLKLTIKEKTHDDGKLYGAINSAEIVDLLAEKGICITKNKIEFKKSIKSAGTFDVTIKLSSKLKPTFKLTVVSE